MENFYKSRTANQGIKLQYECATQVRISHTFRAFFFSFVSFLLLSITASAQTISISDVTVSGCYLDKTLNSKATVTMLIKWTGVPYPTSKTVQVKLGAFTRTFDIGKVSFPYNTNVCTVGAAPNTTIDQPVMSPQAISFEVDANGASHALTAKFTDNSADSGPAVNVNAPTGCPRTACSAGGIGGVVFNDYDADGVRDVTVSSGVESGETNGVQGVNVKVIDNTGATFTATTDKYGYYVITGTPVFPVRVEFSNIPTLYKSASTFNGSSSRTTVQFLKNSTNACKTNLGVNDLNDYCDSNPKIYTTCYVNGDPTAGGSSGTGDALVGMNYSGSGKTAYANGSQIGAAWGLAYNRKTKKLFISSLVRRHAGFGPRGIGGIYVHDIAANTVSNFVDLDNNDDDGAGGFGEIGLNLGSPSSNTGRSLPASKGSPSNDAVAFDAVGTQGLGDLDISDDGNTLYTINLNTKELVILDITAYNTGGAAPSTATSVAIPSPGCAGGVWRPFALKYFKGKLYVGGICDGSTTAGTYPNNKVNLRAIIYEYNGSSFTSIMEFPLTYPKGYPNRGDDRHGWFPWVDDFSDFLTGPGSISFPQPILADIEFDIDGSMVLGFADRTGLQTGNQNYGTTGSTTYYGWNGGDILKAYAAGGVFVIENNGQTGPFDGYGSGNNQGLGFGEFYNDDWCSNLKYHSETIIGGLAIRPGSGQTVASSMDPLAGTPWSAGLRFMNNNTGLLDNAVVVYTDGGQIGGGTFAKSAGLGDVEITCAEGTYLQIGNRIWEDKDKDGIQDPSEAGIQNVNVSLYLQSGGAAVGSTTTDANGEYYFNALPNTPYYIVIGDGQQVVGKPSKVLIGGIEYTLTLKDTGEGSSAAEKDLNDSDAALGDPGSLTNKIFITLTTGGYGEDNHTFDAGFAGCYVSLAATNSAVSTPVCTGITVNLSSTPTSSTTLGSVTYSWNGPDNFVSTDQNPTLPTSSLAQAGSYTVTVTETSQVNICTVTATTSVKLKVCCTSPVLTPSNNSPVCVGASLSVDVATSPTDPAQGTWVYSWSGPSFNNATKNPVVAAAASLANAGNYSVTVLNVVGGVTCSATAQTVVAVNPNPIANPSSTPVCAGFPLNLNANASGGTGTLSYTWNGQGAFNANVANPSVTGINAGSYTYSVTVRDLNSCSVVANTAATVYPNPAAAPAFTPVCAGKPLSLSANASGGTPGYTYSWNGNGSFNNSSANPVVTGLPAGNPGYTVTVTDTHSCTTTASIAATIYPNPTASPTTVPVCEGSTLIVNANASGGTGALGYLWTGPGGYTSNVASPSRTPALPSMSGNYSVTVTDTHGCSVEAFVLATVWPSPKITIAGVNTCFEKPLLLNGNVSGGTPPFVYAWTGPGTFSSTSMASVSVTGLGVGNYTFNLLVTDVHSCTDIASKKIEINPLPNVTVQGAEVCEGQATTVSATGGFQYIWESPAANWIAFGSNTYNPQLANNIPPGTYTFTVTVTNPPLCTASATTIVKVNPKPSATTTGSDICAGQTINLDANGSGGTGTYTYSWAGPGQFIANVKNPTRTGATTAMGGIYTVTVTDSKGCTTSAEAAVIVRPIPLIVASGSTVCEGQPVGLSASGGGTYSWTGPGAFNSNSQTPAVSGLNSPGIYSYTVTVTNNGCTASAPAVITINPKPSVGIQADPVCEGATLALIANGSGGTPAYSYSWGSSVGFTSSSQSPTRPSATTNMSGNYSVTVTDSKSCTATASVVATVNPNPAASAASNSPICVGSSLNLSALPAGPYTYTWTGPNFSSNNQNPTIGNATVANAGIYSLTVRNTATSCTATAQATVIVNTQGVSITSNTPVCSGKNIVLNTSGGGSSYVWAGPNNFSANTVNPSITISNVTDANGGIYTVTITGNGGCTGTATTSVEVRPTPTAGATVQGPGCEGGVVNLIGSGGGTYQWSGQGIFNSLAQNPVVSGLQSGAYTYTVTVNVNSCTATAITVATVYPKPTISISASPICSGEQLNLLAVVNGGQPTYAFTWNSNNGFVSNAQSPSRFPTTVDMGGQYSVLVSDSRSCTATASTFVVINATPTINVISNSPVCVGSALNLSTTTIPQGSYSYTWKGPNFISDTQNPNIPSAVSGNTGNYSVTIRNNNTSCTATAQTAVVVNTQGVGISSNGPICSGQTLSLSASGGGSGYTWIGPNNFTSLIAAPSIPNASPSNAGIYSVTVAGGGCSGTATIAVEVRTSPIASASTNATINEPVCQGAGVVNLLAAGGGTYSWSGPNGFSALIQNPSISNVTGATAGTYTVTVRNSDNTCFATAQVPVFTKVCCEITIGASANAVCEGGTINLSASSVGTVFSWSGPNGFTSNQQNPVRTGATASMAGVYTVTVRSSANSTCSATTTTSVTVNTITASASANGPVSSGSTILLNAVGGGTYSWSGPGGFNSTQQSPTRTNATTDMSGTYTVTVSTQNSCTATATVAVQVNPPGCDIGVTANSNANNPICTGQTIQLSATGTGSVASYAWTGPNNFTNGQQNPTLNGASTSMSGIYTVKVTSTSGTTCTASATTSVSIKVCLGSIGDYVWKDANENGLQDADENGVKGVSVELYATDANGNATGSPIKTTTTDDNGKYLFDQLPSADYRVKFVISSFPAGCVLTKQDAGTDDTKDSDSDPNGFSPRITIDATGSGINKDNPTIDAGLKTVFGSIGDYVWKDANLNGLQDPDEKGVKGVTVELYKLNPDGSFPAAVTKTAVTDDNGKYLFDQLPAGDYKVKFVTSTFPADCILTISNAGDDSKDSDVGPDGFAPTVTINPSGTGLAKDNLTIDAGLIPQYGSIGDYVWKDANSNGIQDPDEKGVKGVTVELYKTDINGNPLGGAIKTAITDDNGKYLFDQLPSGEYRVKFLTNTFPAGCTLGKKDQGNDDAKDSDADPASGFSPRVSINALGTGINKDNLTIDAGLVNEPLGSIGDFVWKDANSNGVQDPGELGVKGVTVELYKTDANGNPQGAAIQTATTNEDGYYQFTGLPAGDYKVKFVISSFPVDCNKLTEANKGTDDTKDSDAGPDGFSPKITINPNGSGIDKDNPTVDAGLLPQYGSIGDYVWKDLDKDGIQDPEEKGVKGITVELYKTDANGVIQGGVFKTAVTDNDGKYLFDQLPSGNYKVKFVTTSFPVDCTLTTPNAGDDTKDSDANPDGFSPVIPINAGGEGIAKNNLTIDAGLVSQFGSLGDYVWKDANDNGVQDDGEKGVEGVKVELYTVDAQGTRSALPLKTTATDATGHYGFDNLATGDYQVKFVSSTIPKDCYLTTKTNQGDDAKDSDADPTTGFAPKVSINANGSGIAKDNPTIDAGLVTQYGSLGDYVWLDVNRDGIQGNSESPLQGIKVVLCDAAGVELKSTVTDENGKYLFDNLPSGVYRVKFFIQPGTEITKQNQGGDDTKDSDAAPDGTTPLVTIDASLPAGNIGRNNPTIDAGIAINYGSLGDYVWKDMNENGLQDKDEPGVKGVKVSLYDAITNQKIDEVITDNSGYYKFDQLLAGLYKVQFTNFPTDCELIKPNQGGDDTKDSDVNPDNGFSPSIKIDPSLDPSDIGRNNPTVDAGLIFRYGSLGDYVWFDKNNDGIQEANEEPIKDLEVILFKQDGNGNFLKEDTRITDANGKYLFGKLLSGNYKVQFVIPAKWLPANPITLPNQGANDAIDSDALPFSGFADPKYGCTGIYNINTALPVADIGRNNPTVDGGIDPFGSIGDFVWSDKNNNGVQDAGEPGIPGVKVVLFNSDKTQELETTTTDANGHYSFDKLTDGDYFVKFILPPNSIFAPADKGGDDTKDSDAKNDGFSDKIPINLTLDFTDIKRNNYTIDAGIVPCVKPDVSVEVVLATCINDIPQPDGKFILYGFTAGMKFDYVIGDTYNGLKTFGTAMPIPNDGLIAGNLTNPPSNQKYTIRIWSSEGCYTDKTVTLLKNDCKCGPPKCIPFEITKTK